MEDKETTPSNSEDAFDELETVVGGNTQSESNEHDLENMETVVGGNTQPESTEQDLENMETMAPGEPAVENESSAPTKTPIEKAKNTRKGPSVSTKSKVDEFENMKSFGRYENLREIGAGGMAKVYSARDTLMERDVALKVMKRMTGAEEKFKQRFK